ncbi:protein-transporting protein BCP1 Ecym_5518 [Eremothecium cymbalariae DBVPG|uniref:Protein BCP1 n=1 Tax=Eremothecium cymbalariae (strain CBS 270.75 / DBVPG 7215 / KCTC 17166 / NRRL Y-17582) TaxID=931890 RepID=I6NDW8_ERECY|nr:hypothetical protein Ecym_5518 [Eremothecium cymbalariae DBVPG\
MRNAIKLSELAKRKREEVEEDSDVDLSTTNSELDDDNASSNEEIINIDFDFFNGNPEVDFHALKNLMRQLFGQQESNKIQLSSLADLILKSPTTTIKTDGEASDPYCFLSILNYKENKSSNYARYLANVDTKLDTFFKSVESSNKSCGLIVGERLINMPNQVVPPLYKITLEDVKKVSGKGMAYDFYVIVSRKYEVSYDDDDDDDDDDTNPRKRVKNSEVDYFHEEDRFLEKHSKIHFQGPVRKGVLPSYIVIDHDSLMRSIQELEEAIAQWSK